MLTTLRFSAARQRASVFAALAVLAQLVVFCTARTSPSMKVELSHGGVVVGRHLTTYRGRHMRAFMGIPYALPPIGELRFKPPQPFGAWEGERMAIADSPKCTQRDPFRRDMEIQGSEDCLYLNVYTPEEPRISGPLPVMVWFHGGGWQCGSGIHSFYGPDFLLDHDVILVSANFRLGPLGFLSTETLDCPGNFGLKDQVEILKWVQTNIGAFDGDRNSVTIFGESAGGASVTYHMLSQQSEGLFHRGIAQSGTYFNPWAQPAHGSTPAKRARKTAKLVGCDADASWDEILKCLRSKTAEEVVATIYDHFEWDFDPMIPFPPVVEPKHDGAFLTQLPRDAAHPHGLSKPLIIGATSEEGLLRTAALFNHPELMSDFKKNFHKILPIVLNYDHYTPAEQADITRQIETFYFKDGHNYDKRNHQSLTDLVSDGWFVAGIDEYLRLRMNAVQRQPSKVAPTYVYLFEQKAAASFSELFKGGDEDYYGACHAEELQYLFPIANRLFATASPTKQDIQVREAMLELWVNFANNSNPTPSGTLLPTWPASQTYPVDFVRIGGKDEQTWTLLTKDHSLYQERVDFWHELKPHLHAPMKHKDEL